MAWVPPWPPPVAGRPLRLPSSSTDRRMVRRPVESCCAPQDASDGPTAPRALGNAVEHDPEQDDRDRRRESLPEEVAPDEARDDVEAETAGADEAPDHA